MKNTGFTLIELLGVISIIVIVAGIATFSILDILEQNKNKAWKYTKDNLELSAENYVKEMRISCMEETEDSEYSFCEVTINDLLNYGYVLKEVTNPNNPDEETSDNIIRVYVKENVGLIGIYDENQNYAQALLNERLSSD